MVGKANRYLVKSWWVCSRDPCSGTRCGEPPLWPSGVKTLWSSWDIVRLQIQFSQSFIRPSQAVGRRASMKPNKTWGRLRSAHPGENASKRVNMTRLSSCIAAQKKSKISETPQFSDKKIYPTQSTKTDFVEVRISENLWAKRMLYSRMVLAWLKSCVEQTRYPEGPLQNIHTLLCGNIE